MRKSLSLLSMLAWLLSAETAEAAFPSCQDAKNYGENSARLFVGQSFARIACDGELLQRVHVALDRVLARQVLRTNDSDEEKLCFYEGMFEGLTEELRARYASCDEDPRFACVPGELLASHAGSLLSALSQSLLDPQAVELDALSIVFQAAQGGGPSSICAQSPKVCEGALVTSLTPFAQTLFAEDAPSVAALLCSEATE